jgi:uncharacterized protein (DUF1778 family)
MSTKPRSSTVTIRLSAAERGRLTAVAAREGRTLGAHVKSAALATAGTYLAPNTAIASLLDLADEFERLGLKRPEADIRRELEADREDR